MLRDHADGFVAVGGSSQDLEVLGPRDGTHKAGAELLRVVCNNDSGLLSHKFLS